MTDYLFIDFGNYDGEKERAVLTPVSYTNSNWKALIVAFKKEDVVPLKFLYLGYVICDKTSFNRILFLCDFPQMTHLFDIKVEDEILKKTKTYLDDKSKDCLLHFDESLVRK